MKNCHDVLSKKIPFVKVKVQYIWTGVFFVMYNSICFFALSMLGTFTADEILKYFFFLFFPQHLL